MLMRAVIALPLIIFSFTTKLILTIIIAAAPFQLNLTIVWFKNVATCPEFFECNQ